jgi:DegV family protein with EDD domain
VIRVVTDSACDLPADLASERGIEIVPLTIRFGDAEFVDRRDLTKSEFWARCASSPTLPETAAPPPGAFRDAYLQVAKEGADGVVCVNISSRLSATIQSAQAAVSDVESDIPVRVIDSLNASMGQGLVALAAADAAIQGADLETVADTATKVAASMKLVATLGTLENLKKGGRIGGAQAFLGSVLSIKPVIEVADGVVEEESKHRTRARSLRHVVDRVAEAGPIEKIAVLQAEAPDVEEFVAMVCAVVPKERMIRGDVGPVIGTHAGPGAIGCAWYPPLR